MRALLAFRSQFQLARISSSALRLSQEMEPWNNLRADPGIAMEGGVGESPILQSGNCSPVQPPGAWQRQRSSCVVAMPRWKMAAIPMSNLTAAKVPTAGGDEFLSGRCPGMKASCTFLGLEQSCFSKVFPQNSMNATRSRNVFPLHDPQRSSSPVNH